MLLTLILPTLLSFAVVLRAPLQLREQAGQPQVEAPRQLGDNCQGDADAPRIAQPEGIVREQLERDAEEGDGGYRAQGVSGVGEGLLDARGDEDDADDHTQVQVAVGVTGQAGTLVPPRPREPPLGGEGNVIEVGPPQPRGDGHPEEGRPSSRSLPGPYLTGFASRVAS